MRSTICISTPYKRYLIQWKLSLTGAHQHTVCVLGAWHDYPPTHTVSKPFTVRALALPLSVLRVRLQILISYCFSLCLNRWSASVLTGWRAPHVLSAMDFATRFVPLDGSRQSVSALPQWARSDFGFLSYRRPRSADLVASNSQTRYQFL